MSSQASLKFRKGGDRTSSSRRDYERVRRLNQRIQRILRPRAPLELPPIRTWQPRPLGTIPPIGPELAPDLHRLMKALERPQDGNEVPSPAPEQETA